MFRCSRQYFAIESLSLFVVDILLVVLAVIFALMLRFKIDFKSIQHLNDLPLKVFMLTSFFIISFYYNELYNGKWRVGLNFLVKLGISMVISSLGLMVLYYAVPQYQLGRGVFFISNILIFLFISLWRYFYETYLVREQFKQNLLIIGTGEKALELARIIEEKRNSGYHLVGFVDSAGRNQLDQQKESDRRMDTTTPRRPLLQLGGN